MLRTEETIGGTPLSLLVSMLEIPLEANIDVLNQENAPSYWERSDRFDMALDLTVGHTGLGALAEAMRRWIMHLLGVGVTIDALTEQRKPLTWYVGLDAEPTRIGDLIWHGGQIDEASRAQVAGRFRLTSITLRLPWTACKESLSTLFSSLRLIMLSA